MLSIKSVLLSENHCWTDSSVCTCLSLSLRNTHSDSWIQSVSVWNSSKWFLGNFFLFQSFKDGSCHSSRMLFFCVFPVKASHWISVCCVSLQLTSTETIQFMSAAVSLLHMWHTMILERNPWAAVSQDEFPTCPQIFTDSAPMSRSLVSSPDVIRGVFQKGGSTNSESVPELWVDFLWDGKLWVSGSRTEDLR